MIYAKCIRGSQIAKSKEEFLCRQDEEYCVYCEGETTKDRNMSGLNCVPLNYIYNCLKYGDHIAIIDVKNEEIDYPLNSSYLNVQLIMHEQYVVKIMKAASKEAIDFVFDNVKNNNAVHEGYVHFLPKELADYFSKRKKGLIG